MSEKSIILLIQPVHRVSSKTYAEFESLTECIQTIIKIYEEHLKHVYNKEEKISYNVSQLMEFIQEMSDILVLIFDKELAKYRPHGKGFVKQKVYGYLAFTAINKNGKSYYF